MRKDLKIGMGIGMVLVIGATLVISLLPSSTVERRLRETATTDFDNAQKKTQLAPSASIPPQQNKRDTASQPAPEKQDPTATQQIHIVIKNQTLSELAVKYYDDPRKWKKIYDANPGIKPDKLLPGTKLTIPK